MPQESAALVEARRHLRQFEQASADRGRHHLSDALGLLRDIVDGDAVEGEKTIARNLVASYGKNVLLKGKEILKASLTANEEIVDHGYQLMKEFSDNGFEIGGDFDATKDSLLTEYTKILISQLSPYQRSVLLKDLQAGGQP